MRILIAVDKFTGGAGNVAQQLASLFSREEDYSVGLMVQSANAKPKYDLSRVEIINQNAKEGKHMPLIRALVRNIKGYYKLGRLINDWHADVIISFLNSISVPLLISQWNTKTPIIVSERSDPYFEWKHNKFDFNLRWWLSYKRADLIVYQYHYFEPFFKSQYTNGKTVAIPNMLYNTTNLVPVEKLNDKIQFVTLASLTEVKRIDLMINLFAEIHKRYPDTVLNIYGDGPERKKLERQVDDLELSESVFFHGLVTDTFSALRKNDIFLLTSEREGFPNAVIEAMSVGLVPIVFKFHEGISEIISDNDNGFLVEYGDNSTFIKKSCLLVNNRHLRLKMSEKSSNVNYIYGFNTIYPMWKNLVSKVME